MGIAYLPVRRQKHKQVPFRSEVDSFTRNGHCAYESTEVICDMVLSCNAFVFDAKGVDLGVGVRLG